VTTWFTIRHQKILEIVNRIVDNGNTVLISKLNLDVLIRGYIIDLGPGGDNGEELIDEGTPDQLVQSVKEYTACSFGNRKERMNERTEILRRNANLRTRTKTRRPLQG
jgi:excinuclease UvrABC ATPase subunit